MYVSERRKQHLSASQGSDNKGYVSTRRKQVLGDSTPVSTPQVKPQTPEQLPAFTQPMTEQQAKDYYATLPKPSALIKPEFPTEQFYGTTTDTQQRPLILMDLRKENDDYEYFKSGFESQGKYGAALPNEKERQVQNTPRWQELYNSPKAKLFKQKLLDERSAVTKWVDNMGKSVRESVFGDYREQQSADEQGLRTGTGNVVGDITSDIAGEALGFAVNPGGGKQTLGGGLLKLGEKLGEKLSTVARVSNKVGKTALKGALTAAPYGTYQGIVKGEDAGGIAQETVSEGLIGAGLGVGGVLLGKGFNAIKKALKKPVEELAQSVDVIPLEKIVRPASGQGKYKIVNRELKKAWDDYDTAIERIQNKFGTNQLRADELVQVKPELDAIVARIEALQSKQLLTPKQLASKRVYGLSSKNAYNLTQKVAKQSGLTLSNPTTKTTNFKPDKTNNAAANIKEFATGNITQSNISAALPDEDVASSLKFKRAPQESDTGIDLQNFSGDSTIKKKSSRFRTNTIERSTMMTDEVKAKLKPEEFDYIPETKEEWADNAAQNIATNKDNVIRGIYEAKTISGGTQSHEAALLTSDFLNEATQTNSFAKLKSFIKTVAERTREFARGLKGVDTAWDKKSAEGALMDAQRTVDMVEDKVKKTNPAKTKKIDDETKKVKDVIDTAHKEAAKQTQQELLPEEILAQKVSDTLKQPTRKTDPLKDMVNELFKVAKESPLSERELMKRNPIEFLQQAIQNKTQYADVWEKAKAIVKEKYKDDTEATSILEDYFNKGIIPTYSENTLTRSIQTALKTFDQKLINIAKSTANDKQKVLQELIDYLTDITGATADDATLLANKIQSRFEQLVKEKSQSILKQMFQEQPRKGQKSVFEKIMELINLGAYEDDAIRDIIKQKEGLPILEDSDIKAIVDYMDRASKAAEGSYEQRMLRAKAGQIIANKIPSEFAEKFQAGQRILMLLNPKTTLVRNPLGNALLGSLEAVKNIPGAAIDKAVSAIRKSERTTLLSPIKKATASAKGASKGLKEWAADIKNSVDTSPTGGQVELPKKSKIFNEDARNPVLRTVNKSANYVHGLVGRMLQLGDRPFYEAAYNSRLEELKQIKKTTEVTPEIAEQSHLFALERTLQNDSELAKIFVKVKHLSDNPVYKLFINLVIPFAKTPANILDKFIDYSPAGTLKAIGHAVATKGKGTFNQKKFVDTMARSLTGTGLAMLGYLLAQKGIITGAKDKNNKLENIETALGKQNYAFRVGDNYQTYDWALPAAAPIAMGADIYNAVNKTKEGQNAFLKGTESAVNLLFQSTLLRGPSELTGGLSPAVSLGQTLLGATTQATPTIGKQFAQLVDPYVRETYDPNVFKMTLNKTINRIPFASKTLPVKQNVFGEDVEAYQGKNNIFNVMFNPGFNTKYNPDTTQREIMRLYTESGETGQLPAVVEKYIAETKEHPRYNLTADEYVQYQGRTGQLTMRDFRKEMRKPEYRDMNDQARAKKLRDIVEDSKATAKEEIVNARLKLKNPR